MRGTYLRAHRLSHLRAHRLSRGLTQRVLAERVGVSHTLLSLWETGKRPVPFVARLRLARTFLVSWDELYSAPAAFSPSTPLYAGDQLHAIRLTRGLTQTDLAAELAVGTSVVSSWETSKRPIATHHLKKLLEVLEIEVNELRDPLLPSSVSGRRCRKRIEKSRSDSASFEGDGQIELNWNCAETPSIRAHIHARLCLEHQASWAIGPARPMLQLIAMHCANQPSFLSSAPVLWEFLYRLVLKNAGQPISPKVISEQAGAANRRVRWALEDEIGLPPPSYPLVKTDLSAFYYEYDSTCGLTRERRGRWRILP